VNQRFEAQYNTKKAGAGKSTGVKANTKFMIQSRMGGGRVMYVAEHMGGGQYRMKIRQAKYDNREFFYYNSASGVLESALNRGYGIAVQKGKNNRGALLVLRPKDKTNTQVWSYKRNSYHNWSPFSNKGLCMDVAGNSNKDGATVHMWSCHNGANQRFEA
jgi:hypothetical protein